MPKVRCQYDKDKMKDAIQAVQMGMSGRVAAFNFGVPRTTLMNKLNNKEEPKMGRCTVLSPEEEARIVEWMLKCRRRGSIPTKDNVLNSIQTLISSRKKEKKSPFVNNRPGRTWFQLFMNRHPILSKGQRDPQEKASEASSTILSKKEEKSKKVSEGVRIFFEELKPELESIGALDILSDPSRVFCSDEHNIELCPKTGRVIGIKTWQSVYDLPSGPDRSTMSFLQTFCANGEVVLPAVIYPYIRIPAEIIKGVPDNFYIGSSEVGWMRAETFQDFLVNAFCDWLNEHEVPKPVIMFVRGKTTHTTVQLYEELEAKGIILCFIPNGTEELLHPARTGDIPLFKASWRDLTSEYHRAHPTASIRRVDVASLLGNMLSKLNRVSVIGGFALAGLCPFQPDIVDVSKGIKRLKEKDPLTLSSQSPRYRIAKSVMMELLSKNKIKKVKENTGDKGLTQLWNKINEKLEGQPLKDDEEDEEEEAEVLKDKVQGQGSSKYEISLPIKEMTEEVVISLDSDKYITHNTFMISHTEEPTVEIETVPLDEGPSIINNL
eukprot:TRINITY_DN25528_c0_g1_i1.p1 TRINITY_DN25528_c0_g1~~TRINITY_DN25528_c0_g1_i1.p1  ORF type:complete len:549 (+),score=107.82 TRINITY_DN25528_c0_g1_i1:71-1717(+)